ncbi:MAG: DnaJ family domain-containing protein [Acidimicrobiales bacterium]
MELFESIADRRIREARAAGLFDDLPGAGKPLPDLHQERESGWWACRAIALERDKARYEELADRIRAETVHLWRLDSENELLGRVDALNRLLADYNRTTSFVEHQLLEPIAVARRWRTLQRPHRSR